MNYKHVTLVLHDGRYHMSQSLKYNRNDFWGDFIAASCSDCETAMIVKLP